MPHGILAMFHHELGNPDRPGYISGQRCWLLQWS
jgi:hypothetical protein